VLFFLYRENRDFSILMKDICCVCGRVALRLPTVSAESLTKCFRVQFLFRISGAASVFSEKICFDSLEICYSCDTDWRCDE
jgi:hypothetical protein